MHGGTKQSDKQYFLVLVEQYRPETRTFHFPWGELAITLSEFTIITGLQFEGKEQELRPGGPSLVQRAFSVRSPPRELGEPRTSLQLSWVELTLFPMDTAPPQAGIAAVKRRARAMLWSL